MLEQHNAGDTNEYDAGGPKGGHFASFQGQMSALAGKMRVTQELSARGRTALSPLEIKSFQTTDLQKDLYEHEY